MRAGGTTRRMTVDRAGAPAGAQSQVRARTLRLHQSTPSKHHFCNSTRRLRRPEGRHELEGRAERECGAEQRGERSESAGRGAATKEHPLEKWPDRREARSLHCIGFAHRFSSKKTQKIASKRRRWWGSFYQKREAHEWRPTHTHTPQRTQPAL